MEQSPSSPETNVAPGAPAPDFRLTSIQGDPISLARYRQQKRVILWFSRGFTCNFCRRYMDGIISHYEQLAAADIEVIQVAPNLLETAQRFFAQPPPYPFVCDPDKRLYAIYNIGDKGVLEASKNTVVAFGTAFLQGEGVETVRASWIDVANRNFVRRLAHHALTAVEQGLFFLDLESCIRHQVYLQSLEAIPDGRELLAIAERATA